MSEGELKQQIRQKADIMYMVYDTYPPTYEHKPHLSDVNAIIDEAAKDFPKYERHLPEDSELDEYDLIDNEEVWKWFLKWFGEQK